MAQKVVLLLEDDESVQLVTSDFLSSEGYIVKTSKTIKKFLSRKPLKNLI